MATSTRQVLDGVERLSFGPESDIFSSALRIVLDFLGHGDAEYHSYGDVDTIRDTMTAAAPSVGGLLSRSTRSGGRSASRVRLFSES